MSPFATIWFFIIGFAILMYVILDGFTLGIGIVMPFIKDHDRNIAFSVVLPNWDGNQTWLVLGGASLYGAFPLAFSTLLPILYLPLMMMVVFLLFRGVCFEFRLKAKKNRRHWDSLFIIASFLVAFIQGIVLGSFIQGYQLGAHSHHMQWLTPFSMITGVAVVCAYGLLGATRLVMKTEGKIQEVMFNVGRYAFIFVAFFMIIATLLTPIILPMLNYQWIADKHEQYLLALPIIAIVAVVVGIYALFKKYEHLPYWCAVVIFLSCYFGFAASNWPYIVPRKITIWQAASPDSSLLFILVGACIMIPVLLFYTGYSYYIFRGKVKDEIHY